MLNEKAGQCKSEAGTFKKFQESVGNWGNNFKRRPDFKLRKQATSTPAYLLARDGEGEIQEVLDQILLAPG